MRLLFIIKKFPKEERFMFKELNKTISMIKEMLPGNLFQKRLSVFIIVSLFVVLGFFQGCGGGGRPSTSLPGSQIISLMDDAIEKYNTTLPQGKDVALKETVDWLNKQPGVKNASLSPDGETICLKYTDGTEAMIFTTDLGTEADEPLESLIPKSFVRISPGSKNAIILNAFPDIFIRTPKRVYQILEYIGYNCTMLTKEQVTLSALEGLSQYGCIYLDTHGGTDGSKVGLLTGEIASDSKLDIEPYKSMRLNGEIFVGAPLISFHKYFGIYPSFIAKRVRLYPRSLVTVQACDSLANNSMASAFIAKGAYAYVGWKTTIFSPTASGPMRKLYQLLADSKNLGEAMEEVNNPNFTFYPSNHRDLTLTEKKLKIAVTTPYFDDIGSILNLLGYKFDEISIDDLSNSSVTSQYDVICLNCAPGFEEKAPLHKENLRSFVENGGRIYASDWAFASIVAAFPGKLTFYDYPYIGDSQDIRGFVVDRRLANYLGTNEIDLTFDLRYWVPIKSVDPSVITYISGSYNAILDEYFKNHQKPRTRFKNDHKSSRDLLSGPIAVGFTYGKGKVVYTSFHNHPQISNVAKALLEYLALM
jgi:hypothetical protein